jgi:sigma-B regulation protein RsbU (phosphoserine phosphatase)
MSASIVRLLEEVSEKKLLEQELEIAREVQATLFPKQLPSPRGLAIFGGCEPARTVSGDYYDFIVEDEAHLHIVVGDISGKGISAALLMATLQAAMRSQLLTMRQAGSESLEQRLSDIMAIFTDGVTEAMNGADEEFGEERLIQALQESQSHAPEGIYRHVTDRVRSWQGAQKQHDDITLIVVKVA